MEKEVGLVYWPSYETYVKFRRGLWLVEKSEHGYTPLREIPWKYGESVLAHRQAAYDYAVFAC